MTTPDTDGRTWLLESVRPLAERFDVALLDLDGTVYVGPAAVPGAPDVLAELRQRGVRPAFVTNNASRPPGVVAEHLTELGIPCDITEVVTAAQAGAGLVARLVPPGSKVLVVGGAGIREALVEVGLEPVERADQGGLAILQGWAPELSWPQLAEGAYALSAGLPWVVTNTDATLPTARGIAPGNGSFVNLLAGTTGRAPDAIAGKPRPPLLQQAVQRLGAAHPLVVGDRLDTDIEGATAVDLPSLLVLTGVTDVSALLAAPPVRRPTYLSKDLSGLLHAHRAPQRAPATGGQAWRCGSWAVTVRQATGEWEIAEDASRDQASGPADPADLLRACCAAAWLEADEGREAHLDQTLVNRIERARGR